MIVAQLFPQVLQPFLEATEELSGDKYPSMSLVLQIVRSIQEILMVESTGGTCPLLADELLRQMRKYFSNHESSFYVASASVLDPRIKKMPFSSDHSYQIMHQRLVAELQTFQRLITDTSAAVSETPRKPTSLWDSFDKRVETLTTSRTPQVDAEVELTNYLKEPLLKRTEDPLLWWSQREAVYPHLHKLARRHLGVPATSVPSERLFSTAGELISQRRSCLKAKNVNNLLFLNKNLREA